jgi:ATP-dependent helicase/nuclease subunit B
MPAQLIVVCGPPRSGKTERLLARYRRVLAENAPATALWLAPTWRAAADIRGRLLGPGFEACFSPAVMTFQHYAEAVLGMIPEPIRPVNRLMKRQLLRRLIDEYAAAGRLKHFAPIAQTSGLVDLVCDFIAELKRLEIWPEHLHEACTARGLFPKDIELHDLYAAYQQRLQEHQLYDAEGSFWSARDFLGKHWGPGYLPPALPHHSSSPTTSRLPRFVVADGFTDFTRTQHEILKILAGQAEQMFIALPLEPSPCREDLFSKPLATLSKLRHWHPNVEIEEAPRPQPPQWPAMAHVEAKLFLNPRLAQPAPETAGIEILAAARQIGEIELIGRRIKRLLAEGAARPSDVAVVFRSPQQVAPLIAEVFGRLGIPVAMETGQSLDCAPAIRALLALLQLDNKDWPWANLLAVLKNNYFQPQWPEWQRDNALLTIERVVRRLQIPHGRQPLLDQLKIIRDASKPTGRKATLFRNGLSEGDDADFGRTDEANEVSPAHANLAQGVLRRLAAAFDAMPGSATLADWGQAWQTLAEKTGLLRVADQAIADVAVNGRLDHLAWDRLQIALKECSRLDHWLGQHPPTLTRSEAIVALLDLVASESVKPNTDEAGHVRVLSAVSARAVSVPYLFLAGLSEKAFPPPDREDRLYSEAEYQRLIAEGLPLVARTQRSRDEMLLFYEVLTRATRQLFLSYPALDESGQPLSPSPYLKEVEQTCGPGRIARTELIDLSPIPPDDEPLSQAEFRIKAVAEALKGSVGLLAGLIQGRGDGEEVSGLGLQPSAAKAARRPLPAYAGLAENLLSGLQLTHFRQDRQRFGPAEGMLTSRAARAYLSTYYASHVFSATELEQYATCPYRFFLERILKIVPLEDLALQVDFGERGRLAHHVLAVLHRRINQAMGRPASPLEPEPQLYEQLLEETLAEVFATQPASPVQAALREVDRRVLLRWIADYRRQHQCYDALWQDCDKPLRPELFEVSFGRHVHGEDSHSVEQAFELPAGDRLIRISGRIDRIDTGKVAGHWVFNVVDYKTGSSVRFSREAVAAGTALQLPLYALAAMELLLADRDSIPWRAGYWLFRDRGFQERAALRMYRRSDGGVELEPEWEEMRDNLADRVAALVQGISLGQFAVCNADAHCTGMCSYRTICRISQVRALEKTFTPGAENI